MFKGTFVTIWDKYEYDGNCTIEEFCKKIESKYPCTVDSIVVGDKTFYCQYLPSAPKRSKMTFKDTYREVYKKEFTGKRLAAIISVSSETEELPDDFEFPDIILTF